MPDQVGDPARRQFGVRDAVDWFQEPGEFVAAQARDKVSFAYPTGKAPANFDEDFVAYGVTKAIVDLLESVLPAGGGRDGG